MFMFAFLSTFIVLSRIRGVDNEPDRDSSGTPASNIIIQNIRKISANVEPAFYEDSLQLPRRRLLENPRWIKQAYRSNDYNVARRRHRSRNKPDDGRAYHSAVKDDENDEDEDENEEDENENEDEDVDKINDETIDETADEAERADDDQEDEETVNEEPSEAYDYG